MRAPPRPRRRPCHYLATPAVTLAPHRVELVVDAFGQNLHVQVAESLDLALGCCCALAGFVSAAAAAATAATAATTTVFVLCQGGAGVVAVCARTNDRQPDCCAGASRS